MPSIDLIKAVAVTAELCGRTFSPEAAAVFVGDLSLYAEPMVMKALVKCRREVRGALTLQDVVSRLDDGRPGPEEAWAMIPTNEAGSVVWSEEMAGAFGVAAPLLNAGEVVAARMAFKETYLRLVATARDAGKAVNWTASLGHDPRSRDAAVHEAYAKGRISYAAAQDLAPGLPSPSPEMLEMVATVRRLA